MEWINSPSSQWHQNRQRLIVPTTIGSGLGAASCKLRKSAKGKYFSDSDYSLLGSPVQQVGGGNLPRNSLSISLSLSLSLHFAAERLRT